LGVDAVGLDPVFVFDVDGKLVGEFAPKLDRKLFRIEGRKDHSLQEKRRRRRRKVRSYVSFDVEKVDESENYENLFTTVSIRNEFPQEFL